MAVKLFFCYAREDEHLLDQLKRHLKPLEKQQLIELWYDRNIDAGTKWEQEIQDHLNSAQVILLLVSPDFMASDYCYGVEMHRALERHEQGEVTIVPIILRHVLWQGKPLGAFQALPKDGRPITDPSWYNQYGQDQPFFDVAEGIQRIVESLDPTHSLASSPPIDAIEEFVLRDTIEFPEKTLTSLDFNGDTLIAGFTQSENVRGLMVLDFPTRALQATVSAHSDMITSVALSSDGHAVVSGYRDGSLLLSTGLARHKRLQAHTKAVTCLALSEDGQLFVSGGEDGILILWNRHTGGLLRILRKDFRTVTSLAIRSDGRLIVSGHGENTVQLWDTLSGRALQAFEGESLLVFFGVAISSNEQLAACGMRHLRKGEIYLWDIATGKLLRQLQNDTGIRQLAFSKNGKLLFGSTLPSEDGKQAIKVWNPHTAELLQTLEMPKRFVSETLSFRISPDSQYLVVKNTHRVGIWWRPVS